MKIHKISQLFYKSALTAAIALMGIGCASDDAVDAGETVDFELTTYSITFTEASTETIRLRAPGKWEIKSDQDDWLTIFPLEGEGNSSVDLAAIAGEGDKTESIQVIAYDEDEVTVLGTYDLAVLRRIREYGTALYSESFGVTAVSAPYAYTNMYVGWKTSLYSYVAEEGTTPEHSETVSAVEYAGYGTYIVSNGVASMGNSNVAAYTNASGTNKIYFGKEDSKFSAALTISAVDGAEPITGDTRDYTITFGAHSKVYNAESDSWSYILDKENLLLELSVDGLKWLPVSYEITGGDLNENYWYLATSEIRIPKCDKFYVRIHALTAECYYIDDLTMYGSAGTPTVIDFSDAVADEPFVPNEAIEATSMTIPAMRTAAASATAEAPVVMNSSSNVSFEAVVVNNFAVGNTRTSTLVLQTVDATTGGNGILLYYPDIDIYDLELGMGDKIRVTLMKGEASYSKIDGAVAIIETPSADADTETDTETETEESWIVIDKLLDYQLSPTPITVTDVTALSDYESMLVTVDVTSNTDNFVLSTGSGNSIIMGYGVSTGFDGETLTDAEKVTMYIYTGSSNTFVYQSCYGGIENKPMIGCVMTVASGDTNSYVVAPRIVADINEFYIYDTDYDYRTVTVEQLYARASLLAENTVGSTGEPKERLRLETDELAGEATVVFGVISQNLDGGNWAYSTTMSQDCFLAKEENGTTSTEPHTGLLIFGRTSLNDKNADAYRLPIYVTTGDVVKFTIPDSSTIYLYNYCGGTRIDMGSNTSYTCEYLRSVPVTPVELDTAEKIENMSNWYAGMCGHIYGAKCNTKSYLGYSSSTKTCTFSIFGKTFYHYVNRETGFDDYGYVYANYYYDMTVVCAAHATYASYCYGRHPDDVIYIGQTDPN